MANQDRMLKLPNRVLHGNPSFIPINLTGGIGDVIIARSTIQFLAQKLSILCFSPHAKAINYFGFSVHEGNVPNFTWHLNLNTVAKFSFSNQFSGFLLPEHKTLFEQQQALFASNPLLEILVTAHPKHDAALARFAKHKGLTRESFALYSLGFDHVYHSP